MHVLEVVREHVCDKKTSEVTKGSNGRARDGVWREKLQDEKKTTRGMSVGGVVSARAVFQTQKDMEGGDCVARMYCLSPPYLAKIKRGKNTKTNKPASQTLHTTVSSTRTSSVGLGTSNANWPFRLLTGPSGLAQSSLSARRRVHVPRPASDSRALSRQDPGIFGLHSLPMGSLTARHPLISFFIGRSTIAAVPWTLLSQLSFCFVNATENLWMLQDIKFHMSWSRKHSRWTTWIFHSLELCRLHLWPLSAFRHP